MCEKDGVRLGLGVLVLEGDTSVPVGVPVWLAVLDFDFGTACTIQIRAIPINARISVVWIHTSDDIGRPPFLVPLCETGINLLDLDISVLLLLGSNRALLVVGVFRGGAALRHKFLRRLC